MSIINDTKDYPRLEEWLNKHQAAFCYSLLPRTDHANTPSVQAFKINGRIVHVVLYPKGSGWDVITGIDANDIEKTLADAEKRLGCDLTLVTEDDSQWPRYLPAVTERDQLEEFVRRGMKTQSAIDAAVHRDGLEQLGMKHDADDLATTVRVYLDWVEINRADETDLDERVKAREEMTRYENQLRQLVGWEPSRVPTKRKEPAVSRNATKNLKLSGKDVATLKRKARK